ncbi:unnamed protein product [Plutella xylostella]|uniref:(diamondback moth) hypothetical protein n=1 Tax=Plutella xylostella TaxID=51655 RepID=A0A8S4DH82_PLUXY|nr:unnamed protein product [Plutella xylostella]
MLSSDGRSPPGSATAAPDLEMRSKQQPRPSYRWLNTNETAQTGEGGVTSPEISFRL